VAKKIKRVKSALIPLAQNKKPIGNKPYRLYFISPFYFSKELLFF